MPPEQTAALTILESDMRAIVRLLGNVAVAEATTGEKRKMLMNGLCTLIGADAWAWLVFGEDKPGEQPSFAVMMHGGFTEKQFSAYLETQEHPQMKQLTAPLLQEFSERKTHLTRLRQQIDSENRFPSMDVYHHWVKAGIAPMVLSLYPLPDGQTSGIGLYRRPERELFDERESRIAHIILSEVAWLHGDLPTDRASQGLLGISPRHNTVLNLLLQGHGRKQIAGQLNVTVNTLNGYIKALYTRFGVHSQAELVHRFSNGDHGDTP